ncbi:MAG: Ldh family oxidoreductase [Anaerolineaceae bacterium]|jgi:LDH2 family malate/lactate/ureidoglycolate dehydrogenase
MIKTLIYRAEDVRNFVERFFVKLNVPPAHARIAADVLISADLRGVDSHGIIRLNTYYGTRLRQGLIDPTSPVSVVTETGTTLALDGGNGLGQVVAHHAMVRCIEKARQSGIAMVTVRNSNHYGIAGYYAMMALPHDMIGISFTNSQPLVAPTYGRTPFLGTNPIAVAIPAGEELPYVLDMATSIVPIGRVTVHRDAGIPIPAGWGMDKEGQITTDPQDVLNGGALMPLGGPDFLRGYKGYGLSLLVDLFSGILSGAAYGPHVGKPGNARNTADVGHFFAALRVDAFRPVAEFKTSMDSYIRELKAAPKAAGQNRIYIHGEKEFERAQRYARQGLPIMAATVEKLIRVGEEVAVPFDCAPIAEGVIDEQEKN